MKKLILGSLLLSTVMFGSYVNAEEQVVGSSDNIKIESVTQENDPELAKALAAGYTEEQFNFIMNIPKLEDVSENESNNEVMQSRAANNPITTNEQQKVVNEAKRQLGKPYVWGGKGPNSFDCSGLVQYVYKNAVNMNVPAPTQTQERYGKEVSLSSLQPGDLLFYGVRGDTGHVGIYIGNNQMIHAPKPGQNVQTVDLKWYYPQFARRILTTSTPIDDKPVYYKEDRQVSINKKSSTLWNDINLKNQRGTADIGQVYNLKGSYKYSSGKVVYSLYNNDGSWAGYVDSNTANNVTYVAFNRRVVVNKAGYSSYSDFFFSSTRINTTNNLGESFIAKGYYVLGNGRKYYSLYDDADKWYGYLNSDATVIADYVSINKQVSLKSDSTTTYNDITLLKERNTINTKGKSYSVKASYNLSDNRVIYSLYNSDGSWAGYVNSSLTN